jgi:hypothetical protein
MALTNNLKPILDQPVWEWARFAPATSSSISGLCTSEDGDIRYMYYLVGALFYRYDTITDTYLQLASPLVTPVTAVSLRYSKYSGNRGRVLSQVSSTKLQIPYIGGGSMLAGNNIVIRYGAGEGQERTITSVDPEVIHDSGLCTSTSTIFITDTTKKWKTNQWVGYNCRVSFGNTAIQLQRTIIYNTVDTIWFADSNYQPYEPFDNFAFATAPTATAGSQSSFIITSQNVNLSSALTVPTDSTSRFIIQTGTIWLLSSLTVAPFFTWQMYDVANDIWMSKTANTGLFPTAVGTDFNIERTGARGGAYVTGTATAATNRTLTDSLKSMVVDDYVNYQIRITGGLGMGQRQRIIANGTNYFEVAKKWTTNPDATSTYSVLADTDTIFFSGNGNSSMLKYNVEADLWSQGNIYDYGVTNNVTVQRSGTLPFGISSGTRNTGAITAVVISAAGSGYRIGDVLTVSGGGGTNGKVYVETISSTGQVLSVSLMRCGAGYSVGSNLATTGGTAGSSGATVNISTVGIVCIATTSSFHPFKIGDSVTIKGCTDSAYNTTVTIIGVDGQSATNPSTFEFITTAAGGITATSSQSTAIMVDAAANWDVNELVGKSVNLYTVGVTGGIQTRRIASNTATTITFTNSATAPVTGTSRYTITEAEAIGRDVQFPIATQSAAGAATGGSTTTLIDSSRTWDPGCWTGNRVRIVAGTGLGAEIAITANTNTTLTYATQTFTPDSTTRYQIMATFGIATSGTGTTIVDTTKNWKVNQWAGKRVRITGGINQGNELTVASNTVNTLTFTVTNTSDASTQYTILGVSPRSTGMGLVFAYGNSNGRYLWCCRGGGFLTVDRYDITTDTWQYGNFNPPQSLGVNTGSMYAYDGVSRIYININALSGLEYFDLNTREFINSGTIPYGHSTAILGNRMEIVDTADGLKFLYVMRHSGQEMWRTLLFW